ncbi:MAG: PilX N-terminal domain-containing pilus assembly protein [Gammaproteobacteria bacterium]
MHTQFHARLSYRNPQHGFVLIVALILLLILTVLGLAAAGSTSLEERMAGNARNNDLAFQAAEAGLKAGEACVSMALAACSTFSAGTTGGAGAYQFPLAAPPTTPIWEQAGFWSNAGNYLSYSVLNPVNVPNVTTQPEIIVEEMPPMVMPGSSISVQQFGGGSGTFQPYRITVLGTGGDSSSTVMLQSMYHPN